MLTLRGCKNALAEYDYALLDSDGTVCPVDERIEHAARPRSRRAWASAFVTNNNAMRTSQQVADKLNSMDFEATEMVATSAMGHGYFMAEELTRVPRSSYWRSWFVPGSSKSRLLSCVTVPTSSAAVAQGPR